MMFPYIEAFTSLYVIGVAMLFKPSDNATAFAFNVPIVLLSVLCLIDAFSRLGWI